MAELLNMTDTPFDKNISTARDIDIEKPDHVPNDWDVVVDLAEFNDDVKNRLRRLRTIIQVANAYSIFYHSCSSFWKKTYWISSFIAVSLSAINASINIFYDSCGGIADRHYNAFISTLITVILGVITFMNSSLRNKEYEVAGDDYKALAQEMFRDVFFGMDRDKIEDRCLDVLISRYTDKMNDYGKSYPEPSPVKIKEIMNGEQFMTSIRLLH